MKLIDHVQTGLDHAISCGTLLSLDDILDLPAEEFVEIGRLIHEEEPSSLGRTE